MCSTRGRNKLCLSLDHSSSTTSSDSTHLNRWSEIVPPKTALTFAALWDPDEGMVTFSGASLLESEGLSDTPDVFDQDDRSIFISVNQDTDTDSIMGENTATLTTFQDALKAYLHRPALHESKEHLHLACKGSTPKCMQARASSTFDGLDVYSHDIPKQSLQLSRNDRVDLESSFRTPSAFGRLRLRSDLMLDAYHSENESYAASRHTNHPLKSRFSTTTTSTSTYVHVTNGFQSTTRLAACFPPPVSVSVSQPPAPERDHQKECTSDSSCPCTPRRRQRRLRKRRPCGSDLATPRPNASGAQHQNGDADAKRQPPVTTTTTITAAAAAPSKSARRNLKFVTLARRRPSSDTDGWVCIEVTPLIKQRYIPDFNEDDED